MLRRYKHISFDLDGTLVHTVPEYRHRVIPMAAKRIGKQPPTPRTIDRIWFEANRDLLIKSEFGLDPEIFWTTFRQIDTPEERSKHTKPYDDAERAIRRLKEMGKTVSIITGAPKWIAEMEIGKMNGAPIDFSLPIHAYNFSSKPDPSSFFFVLERLNAKPEETLYIGNSNEDAYFAKGAGVDFLYLERKEHQFDVRDWMITTIHSLDEIFDL